MELIIYGKKRRSSVEITHDVLDRIDANTTFNPDTGCFTWTKAKTPDGYGVMRIGHHIVYVHRVIHTVFVGPIPEGWTVDHTCRNRACGESSHLEAVLWAENSRRVFARRKAGLPW